MSAIPRILGWLLMLSGVAILALIGILWLDGKDIVRTAGETWAELHPFSLIQSQHLTQQYVNADVWDAYAVPTLGQPTWAAMAEISVLMLILGVLFLQLGHRRRPGDRFRPVSSS